MELLELGLAAVIGLSLGLLGGGGSILAVPVFVYVLGFGAKQAIAMSLPVVGATSLVGSISHWRAGRVNLRATGLFTLTTMAGAFAGARLAALVSGEVQLSLFAATMLVAAGFMFRSRRPNDGAESGPDRLNTAGQARPSPLTILLSGAGVGLLAGLVGVGGGFLIVPALVLLANLPMKTAVGTSLLVIAANAFAGFAGYLGYVAFDWEVLLRFTVVAMLGALAGARLVRFVSSAMLRRAFAVFLVVMAGLILLQNRAVFEMGTVTRARAPSADVRRLTGGGLVEKLDGVVAAGVALTNGHEPYPGILTAGQPTATQLRQLAARGVATVIDLRPPTEERGFEESTAARQSGLRYVNVPVTAATLGDEQFGRVRSLLRGAESPLLLHCSTANRVGAVMLPYLVLDRGTPLPHALEEARVIGLRSPELVERALQYIRSQTESGS